MIFASLRPRISDLLDDRLRWASEEFWRVSTPDGIKAKQVVQWVVQSSTRSDYPFIPNSEIQFWNSVFFDDKSSFWTKIFGQQNGLICFFDNCVFTNEGSQNLPASQMNSVQCRSLLSNSSSRLPSQWPSSDIFIFSFSMLIFMLEFSWDFDCWNDDRSLVIFKDLSLSAEKRPAMPDSFQGDILVLTSSLIRALSRNLPTFPFPPAAAESAFSYHHREPFEELSF